MDELMGAILNHQMKLAGGSMRKFLHEATEGVNLGNKEEVLFKVSQLATFFCQVMAK